jgi:double-stranded uracil-DNA glycosylase
MICSTRRSRACTDSVPVQSSGFAPIADRRARVLILGSLPGSVSLQMQQYYAQPHNAFWRLMGRLFDFDAQLPYRQRVAALKRNRIAVWDVCASAYRRGSLDSSIVGASVRCNDFPGFFAEHRAIHTVFFNGAKSADLFRRRVLPQLSMLPMALEYRQLPSTSPAHAARSFAEKLASWSQVRHAAAE